MKAIVVVIVVVALLLAGCQAYPLAPANPPPPPTCEELAQQEQSPENLPFETIAQESAQGYAQLWPEEKPALVILTASDEIADIEPFVRPEAAGALRNVDFSAYLVVAAFSGIEGGGAWQYCILSVTQQGQTVTLHVHLIDSPVHPSEIASYYHLVQLQKESLPTGEITFQLALTRHDYVNPTGRQRVLETSQEEIVASITRSLP